MEAPLFSVIVVCLNPGEKLRMTLGSVLTQTCGEYEILVKDGMSQGDSVEHTVQDMDDGRIRLIQKPDQGIYDAMNQAVKETRGRYLYFLNCGDEFYNTDVLKIVKEKLDYGADNRGRSNVIVYGNIFERKTGQMVVSNPHMDAFGCYRNVPCHQACFYARSLLTDHQFQTRYLVRADYEHFLWAFFKAKAELHYLPVIIADYEGGGFSETKLNRKRSQMEHREIIRQYMTKSQIFKYKAVMMLTLAPLRTSLAQNRKTAIFYQRLKKILYKKG